jgi:hypothetical protein
MREYLLLKLASVGIATGAEFDAGNNYLVSVRHLLGASTEDLLPNTWYKVASKYLL